MGLVDILFTTRVRLGVNASDEFLPYGALELDASIEETHSASNEVTQYPVETGVDITDHVRRQPDRLTIRGIVTDHPLVFGGALRSGRSLEAYQTILTMVDEAQLISVVTSLRQYQNMVIESVEVPRNPQRGAAVEMVIALRELKTAQVASTAGTSDLGSQNSTVVS